MVTPKAGCAAAEKPDGTVRVEPVCVPHIIHAEPDAPLQEDNPGFHIVLGRLPQVPGEAGE